MTGWSLGSDASVDFGIIIAFLILRILGGSILAILGTSTAVKAACFDSSNLNSSILTSFWISFLIGDWDASWRLLVLFVF